MTVSDSSLPSRSVSCESPPSSTGPPPRPSAWCCSRRPARSPRPARVRTRPCACPPTPASRPTAPPPAAARWCAPSSGWPSSSPSSTASPGCSSRSSAPRTTAGRARAWRRPRSSPSAPTARCTSSAPAASWCSSASPSTASRRSAPTPRTRPSSSASSTEDESGPDGAPQRHGLPRRRRALAGPPQGPDGAAMKGPDGTNAVQLLLLVGGLTLIPALLFTVTAFTRIIIVLGFIRQGLGTQSAPPNQVLVGIALFLTIFVMAPTFTAIKKDRHRPAAGAQDHPDPGVQPRPDPAARVHVPPDAHDRPRPVREARQDRGRQDAQGRPHLRPHPRVHHLRAQDGLPDRLPDLPAVPGHRPRGRARR